LLESLHPSVESQTLFVGDIRYDPKYLTYISDEFLFGDPTRENILVILGSRMQEDAVMNLISRLLDDGYNVVAKNHPRYHNRILRDVELPEDANFTILNSKESITRLTEWADLIISGISTAVQEAVIRQKPVIIAEYLLPQARNALPILAPQKLRASTAEQFTDLYAIFRSDSSDERLTASDAFIGRNVYDPIDDRDLEEALNHSIYPRSAR
jgi:CDP-glycerol glycerophosphotransferase (TagB/SpsB family)